MRYVAPYSRALIERIRGQRSGDSLRHRRGGLLPRTARRRRRRDGRRLAHQHRSGLDGHISYRSAVQGNLDPAVLFAPLPELRTRVHELLKRTGSRPGHIFNLGHGILPETPVENVKAVVEIVREFRP